MKVKLRISKAGVVLYEGMHDIKDSESFGCAFAEAWLAIRERKLEKTTSIGALMETLNESVLEEFAGAEIDINRQ